MQPEFPHILPEIELKSDPDSGLSTALGTLVLILSALLLLVSPAIVIATWRALL